MDYAFQKGIKRLSCKFSFHFRSMYFI